MLGQYENDFERTLLSSKLSGRRYQRKDSFGCSFVVCLLKAPERHGKRAIIIEPIYIYIYVVEPLCRVGASRLSHRRCKMRGISCHGPGEIGAVHHPLPIASFTPHYPIIIIII